MARGCVKKKNKFLYRNRCRYIKLQMRVRRQEKIVPSRFFFSKKIFICIFIKIKENLFCALATAKHSWVRASTTSSHNNISAYYSSSQRRIHSNRLWNVDRESKEKRAEREYEKKSRKKMCFKKLNFVPSLFLFLSRQESCAIMPRTLSTSFPKRNSTYNIWCDPRVFQMKILSIFQSQDGLFTIRLFVFLCSKKDWIH